MSELSLPKIENLHISAHIAYKRSRSCLLMVWSSSYRHICFYWLHLFKFWYQTLFWYSFFTL